MAVGGTFDDGAVVACDVTPPARESRALRKADGRLHGCSQSRPGTAWGHSTARNGNTLAVTVLHLGCQPAFVPIVVLYHVHCAAAAAGGDWLAGGLRQRLLLLLV